MPRGKKLNYQDYQKLLELFKNNFDNNLTRDVILKHIGVSKFEMIVDLIKQFASYEDYQYFRIIDKRSKKVYVINQNNFSLEEFKGEQQMVERKISIPITTNNSMNPELPFFSFEEAMEENDELEYARGVEKILPLGKIDLETLPMKRSGKFYFSQNVIFDMTILDSPKEKFYLQLALIPNPKILIYGNLTEELDRVNLRVDTEEDIYTEYQKRYAKSLLKFIGEDSQKKYSKSEKNNVSTPKEIAKYARKKNAIVISSNPKVIAYCRLYNVKFRILEIPFENPFNSESQITCGIDASIISLTIEQLKEKFKEFSSILICDVTLIELEKVLNGDFAVQNKESAEFILQTIAYFGDIKFSSERLSNADQSVVRFYSENPVGLVLTGDFGFSGYARRDDVPYALCLKKNSSKSELTSFFESQYDFEKYINNQTFYFRTDVISITPKFIEINTFTLLLKRVIVQVFSPPQTLKEISDGCVRIYPNDIIVLRTMDLITIVVFSNPIECKGKVWYTGLVENMPEKYKKFLV